MVPYDKGIANWRETKRVLIRIAVLMGDVAAVALAYGFAYLVRFRCGPFLQSFPVTKGFPDVSDYVKAAPVVFFMWALSISWQGAYRRVQLPALDDGIRLFRAAIMGMLLAMSAMFLYRDVSFSRLVFVLGGCFGFAFVYFYRQMLKIAYVARVQRNKRPKRVLVLGNGYLAAS